jgi:hypothetical protein
MNDEVLEGRGRLVAIEPHDVPPYPFANGAKSEMVEGVHP